MTAQPHDALFRSAFEHPADAAAELRHLLPPELVAAIDWSTLRAEPGSFRDPLLVDRESDLLFSVAIDDTRILVYLLLEHQSEVDRRMPFRMLVYITRVWERCYHDHPDRPLPPIVPVLVSHARTGWTAARSLHDLIEPPPASIPGLSALVPNFEIIVDDLARVSNQQLQARAMSDALKLAIWMLRDARTHRRLLDNLGVWARAFHGVATAPTGMHAFSRLLSYLSLVLPEVIFREFRDKLIELAPSTKEATVNYYESVIEEGRAEGIEEGRAEGIEEGRAEGRADGLRAVLVKQLRLKFGALEPAVQQRIEQASIEEIDLWLERVLTASDVAAVLAP